MKKCQNHLSQNFKLNSSLLSMALIRPLKMVVQLWLLCIRGVAFRTFTRRRFSHHNFLNLLFHLLLRLRLVHLAKTWWKSKKRKWGKTEMIFLVQKIYINLINKGREVSLKIFMVITIKICIQGEIDLPFSQNHLNFLKLLNWYSLKNSNKNINLYLITVSITIINRMRIVHSHFKIIRREDLSANK